MGHLAKWDTFGRSGIFFYHFIVMKTSLSGTLNKWDNSLSGTLFSVRKPKMNLTKWDTMTLESSLADLSLTFHSLLVQIILYRAFCRVKYDYKEENKEEK